MVYVIKYNDYNIIIRKIFIYYILLYTLILYIKSKTIYEI